MDAREALMDAADATVELETLRDQWVAERDGGDGVRSRDWETRRTGGAEQLGNLASKFDC